MDALQLSDYGYYNPGMKSLSGIFYDWNSRLEVIDFAFQPIVSFSTGKVYAVEALIRNCKQAGFSDIDDFFDTAYKQRVLFRVDLMLREKAIRKFMSIPFYKELKLFYNYDPRCLEMSDYTMGETEKIIDKYNLNPNQFCFEINEKYKIECFNAFNNILNSVKKRGIKVAIDDFGSGFSGLEMFYHANPDYIKFDRFMINEIDKDIKKKILCTHVISLSKSLGVMTIAEGVETVNELNICSELGFDMVQGYVLQKPVMSIEEISHENETVKENIGNCKRKRTDDSELIKKSIVNIDFVYIDDGFNEIFEKFHDKLQFNFFPVIDTDGYPIGVIHEKNIKEYVYSPYGKDILINKSFTKNIMDFITCCPIADIDCSQEKIIELFVNNIDSEGVIIVKEMKYYGFLTAKSLLNMIHEKNINYAIEVNPLTKLPGNSMIERFLNENLPVIQSKRILVYYDFDNFKPFNDRFGFRQGDSVIKIFADILRKNINKTENGFCAHIGGDDFFAGFVSEDEVNILSAVKKTIDSFSDTAASFYPSDEFIKGKYSSIDRYGIEREFELLTVSAAVVIIESGYVINENQLSCIFADVKSKAKKNEHRCEIAYYPNDCDYCCV